jgi:hypothetical protein
VTHRFFHGVILSGASLRSEESRLECTALDNRSVWQRVTSALKEKGRFFLRFLRRFAHKRASRSFLASKQGFYWLV